jgi:hypothetical protein
MPTKTVDVFDKTGKLLQTYPIVLGGLNYEPTDWDFEKRLYAARRRQARL